MSSKVRVSSKGALLSRGEGSRTSVVRHRALKETRVTAEGNRQHPVERHLCVPDLVVSELHEQAISNILDVQAHLIGIHPDERAWEGVADKTLFDGDCVAKELVNALLTRLLDEHVEEEHGKVCMHTLVTIHEFVR